MNSVASSAISPPAPAVERFAPAPLARTERLVEEILSLPMSADHKDGEIDRVIAAVHEFFDTP